MQRRVAIRIWAMSLLLVGLLIANPVAGHEKWFTDASRFPVEWHQVLSLKTLLVILAVGLGLLAAYSVDAIRRRFWPGQLPFDVHLTEWQLERIFAWIPLVLGIHAAVPLLVSGLQMQLFAANLQLPNNFFGGVMALLEITVALSFIYGALTRVFSLVLIALIPLGFFFFSPPYVLEHLDFAGVAVFLFITGRGPFSVDALIGRPAKPLVPYLVYAVPSLRILTGAAIVVLGFTEKIWNERLAESFLAYQDFNFMLALGFEWFTDERFILLAGIIEVLVGAVLISGRLTRLVIATAWIPFNLTLPFLGWVELVGHFPIYGTMVVLLVWGAGQNLGPYVRALERARAMAEGGESSPEPVPQTVRLPARGTGS